MRQVHIISIISCLLAFCFTSCGMESVTNASMEDSLPQIYPDYVGVTIPSRIAPLNFGMVDDNVQLIDVVMLGAKGGELHAQGPESVLLDLDEWHNLLKQNEGDSLKIVVSAKKNGAWITYRPFGIFVSSDEMDYGLAYRKLAPGYEVYSKMGIYQRDLSSFEETAILENTQFSGCVNCHSFNKGNPEGMSLHVRGDHGATLLKLNGKLEAYNTSTDKTLGSCVYPYWHPSGKYIAYSTNTTHQAFHVKDENRIEVFDLNSDVQVYDIAKNELLVPEILKNDSVWETYPVFSADGRTLYFCSASVKAIPSEMNDIRYNLCKIDFNPDNGTFGNRIDTLICAETMRKSINFPKPSYDGKFLMYSLADYGCFSIWHHEADLWLLDLQSGEARLLDEVNSKDTESYHNWSSNNRWFVFSSRRDDGLHTRLYLSHMDENGKVSKPFMLPQENPKHYYFNLFLSYNVPEFITSKVEFDNVEAGNLILSDKRKNMGVRMQSSK